MKIITEKDFVQFADKPYATEAVGEKRAKDSVASHIKALKRDAQDSPGACGIIITIGDKETDTTTEAGIEIFKGKTTCSYNGTTVARARLVEYIAESDAAKLRFKSPGAA